MKNHFVPGIEPLPIIIIISRIWARIWPWERERGKKGEMGGWSSLASERQRCLRNNADDTGPGGY